MISLVVVVILPSLLFFCEMEASSYMGRRVALLSLVALSCHRGVVRADDTLNSVVSEAFGE